MAVCRAVEGVSVPGTALGAGGQAWAEAMAGRHTPSVPLPLYWPR
jgi:hypothetical protein